jgi:hypothetical protein
MLLILDVDADKYDSVVDAMKKRSSIRILSMDREGRKKFVDCPCCGKRLSREQSFTINDQFIECLTQIAQKMTVDKTVIAIFEGMSLMSISPVERERCVVLDEKMVKRAEILGLVKSFVDGMKTTYFVTAAGIDFLKGEKPASPSTIVTLDGEVVETSGELLLDNVKFKDAIHGDTIKRNARDAVKRIPERVMEFVVNGQMSLI